MLHFLRRDERAERLGDRQARGDRLRGEANAIVADVDVEEIDAIDHFERVEQLIAGRERSEGKKKKKKPRGFVPMKDAREVENIVHVSFHRRGFDGHFARAFA